MSSPKLVPLLLPDDEREALAERARIVLACAEEGGVAPLTRVAARTGISRESVRKWRARFAEHRVDGLADGLGDVAAGGRAGDPVVPAEGLDPGPVAEPAQRHDRLLAAGQLPAPGRGPRRRRSAASSRAR